MLPLRKQRFHLKLNIQDQNYILSVIYYNLIFIKFHLIKAFDILRFRNIKARGCKTPNVRSAARN